MHTYKTYLAGPITGLSFNGANDWREEVISSLPPHIIALSPLRGKEYLAQETSLKDSYDMHVLSTAKAIVTRDRFDATRCDVLFVNLLGAKIVSIGTVMEIAWADAHRIPIILIMEKGNIHTHGMLMEVSNYIVETLTEGIFILKSILTP